MTDYPIEPGKLLETAGRLAPPDQGRGRPAYTDHRRAVSTAYYAVFHAITDRVVKAPFTDADVAFLRKVRRWGPSRQRRENGCDLGWSVGRNQAG